MLKNLNIIKIISKEEMNIYIRKMKTCDNQIRNFLDNNIKNYHVCYLLSLNKKILGYCQIIDVHELLKTVTKEQIICIYQVQVEDNEILINDFYIANNKRKKGYGTYLFQYIKRTYYSKCLILHPEDQYARNFWEKFDFKIKNHLEPLTLVLDNEL